MATSKDSKSKSGSKNSEDKKKSSSSSTSSSSSHSGQQSSRKKNGESFEKRVDQLKEKTLDIIDKAKNGVETAEKVVNALKNIKNI